MRRLAPILAAVGALAIAGCGGDDQLSNDEYAKQLQQILAPLEAPFKQLKATNVSTSKEALVSSLSAADGALQKATQEVSALDAPSAAIDSNSDLVTALGTYEKSVAQTLQSVKSGTTQQVKAQAAAFKHTSQAFLGQLKQIKGDLASEGIKVGSK